MRLFCYEFQKLLRCWFLWALLTIFLVFDAFLVWDTVGRNREIYHEMYQIIMQTGTDLTENADKINTLMDSENAMEAYYASYIKAYEDIYADFDIRSILDSKISLIDGLHSEGSYYVWLSRNYETLQARVEQIKATKEDKYAFYPGIHYSVHSNLFITLIQTVALQIIILTALTVLYLMDYERIHATEYLIYSSETGRKLQAVKWLSGMSMSLLYAMLLICIPLALFLLCVPMQGLWETPISSFMVMEHRGNYLYPYVTFMRLSFGNYLLLTLLVILLLLLLIGLLSGMVQFFSRNSYLTMLSLGLLFLTWIALPFLFGAHTGFLHTAVELNPAMLWYMCGGWFIEYDPAVSFAGSEFLTIGVWLIVTLLGFGYGKKYFSMLDL